MSSVPRRYVQGRVAVSPTRNCTLRAEWQCRPHCHSTSSVPKRCAQGRVAVPSTWNCTLRPEWQCPSHCHSTSNARGCTSSHCHSTSSVPRRCAQARVAVPSTWNCTLRPEWQCPSHCHSTSSVPRRYAQARVAGPPRRPSGATAGQGVCRPPGCRELRESDERREEGPAGRQREVREGPAPDRSHPGCGPGLPDGRGDANAAQKSMSTLLKNKFHSLSSGHIA